MREMVHMPEYELERYRKLPMWQERIQLVPTVPRELAFERTYRFDADKFADLHVPTLLLLGGDSPPFFQRSTKLVHAALPDSRVVMLPGQQHIAMDLDPDRFVQEVTNFLST